MYQTPRRLGCSGLSAVTLIMLFVFAFLFLRVTPAVMDTFLNFGNNTLSASTDQGTPAANSGNLNLATQTVEVAATAPTTTPVPIATPTVERACARVGNTESGLRLRAEPDASLKTIVLLPNGTRVQLVEPGATPAKDSQGRSWKQVKQLPPDSQSGYVQSDYLTPVPCP